MKFFTALLTLILITACHSEVKNSGSALNDVNAKVDSDGDGLTDFLELHKYKTDPNQRDSDGDGLLDGEWDERREYAYTIYNRMQILKPFKMSAMNSDYQDARIVKDLGSSAIIEVISYPLNTLKTQIVGNPDWKTEYSMMSEYLDATQTSNWDEAMQSELHSELLKAGIDPDALDDKQLVEQVSQWVMSSFNSGAPFLAYFVDFATNPVTLKPQYIERFRMENPGLEPVQEVIDLGVFGKTMFEQRKLGSCTPSAILMTTIMRALGIPSRLILEVPAIDANDQSQWDMLRDNITHNKVRRTMEQGLNNGVGWASHTYNEVFVGNRWVKLNYNSLGQNILDSHYFGMMVQVNTMKDWAEAGLTDTWGQRIVDASNNRLNPAMSSLNQYMSLEIKDHFGKYAEMGNPEVRVHENLTLESAFYPDDSRLPQAIRDLNVSGSAGFNFLVRTKEHYPEAGDEQYREFLQESAFRVTLSAPGQVDVAAEIQMQTFYTYSDGQEHWALFLLWIPNEAFSAMPSGIEYSLTVDQSSFKYTWSVGENFKVMKRD